MPDNPIHEPLLTRQPGGAPFPETPDGRRIDHAELRALVAGRAGASRARGVALGGRVLCQIAKSPEALVIYLATVSAGCVFADAILAVLSGRLARFKIPRDIRIVPELPRKAAAQVG